MNVDNPQMARRIRDEVFLPALQQAAAEAKQLGASPNDMLSGAMAAMGDMLVTLTGKQGAALLLRGFADHLEQNTPD